MLTRRGLLRLFGVAALSSQVKANQPVTFKPGINETQLKVPEQSLGEIYPKRTPNSFDPDITRKMAAQFLKTFENSRLIDKAMRK